MLRIVKRIMPLLLLIAMDQIIKFNIFTKLMDKEVNHKGILRLSERVLLKEFWNFLKRKYLKHK